MESYIYWNYFLGTTLQVYDKYVTIHSENLILPDTHIVIKIQNNVNWTLTKLH
jgi:hypothetical protein